MKARQGTTWNSVRSGGIRIGLRVMNVAMLASPADGTATSICSADAMVDLRMYRAVRYMLER